MSSATGALLANASIVTPTLKLRRPPSPRRRLSGRAFMRWRFITRAFKRFPTSVCVACSVMLLGRGLGEGALMNMFIRSHAGFKIEADKAKAIIRKARVVASDETGVRIEGTNSYHWVFHCKDAVVHQPDYSRGARVVNEMMGGHAPNVWISDRYAGQQKHGARHQTCLAHLARDTAF